MLLSHSSFELPQVDYPYSWTFQVLPEDPGEKGALPILWVSEISSDMPRLGRDLAVRCSGFANRSQSRVTKLSPEWRKYGKGGGRSRLPRILSDATVLCSGDPITTVPRPVAVCSVYLSLINIHDVSRLSSTAKPGSSHHGYRTIKLKSDGIGKV